MAGEVVKARKTLKELRDEIVEASKERSVIQDDTERLKALRGALESELHSGEHELLALQEEVEKKRKELGVLEDVVDGRRHVVISIDSSIEASALTLSEVESQAKNLLDQVSLLEREHNTVEQDLAGKQLLRARFESEVRSLIGRKVSLEHAVSRLMNDIEKAKDQKEDVLGAINEALNNFRVFERRINQFSKDTGYIVGYTRPDTLIDNE